MEARSLMAQRLELYRRLGDTNSTAIAFNDEVRVVAASERTPESPRPTELRSDALCPIVYLDAELGGIARMNNDGSGAQRIYLGRTTPLSPAWSSRGDRVVVVESWLTPETPPGPQINRPKSASSRYSTRRVAAPAKARSSRGMRHSGAPTTAFCTTTATHTRPSPRASSRSIWPASPPAEQLLLAGTGKQLNPSSYTDRSPTWSPDGTFVLYTMFQGDAADVWWLDTRSGATGRLTANGASAVADWRTGCADPGCGGRTSAYVPFVRR